MSDDHTRNKIFASLKIALWVAGVLITLWTGVYWTHHQSEKQGLEEMRRETAALALLFANHAETTFRTVDISLLELREQWLRQPRGFQQTLQTHLELLGDSVVQVGVINAKGYAVYSNLGLPAKLTYVGEREHFTVHAQSSQDKLFVSRPLKGQVSGKWSIHLSRPIFEKSTFVGVVVISVDPKYFVKFYESAGLGEGGAARMIRDTGEVMARSSEQDKFVGQVIKATPYADPGAPLQGSFRRRAQVDGVDRLSSYYRLPQYGLSVIIGPSVDARLAPVRSHQQQIILAASALSLLILIVAWQIIRNMTRTKDAQQALSESEENFRSLYSSMSEGMALHRLVYDSQGKPVDYELLGVNPAFQTQTGLSPNAVVGKLATEAYGVPEAPFLQHYAAVAQTGQPIDLEERFEPLSRDFRIHAFSPKRGHVATVFQDITESRRLQSLQEADHRKLEMQYQEILQLQEKLLVQVLRDPLTGLHNRRYMDETLPRELARAKREGYPLSLIMVDLDHFKRVNDIYGHTVGDDVLVAMATQLKANARESDIVCRYGGEEFLVLMPQMTPEHAYRKLESWRQMMADTIIHHGSLEIRVTLSAGIAGFPVHGANIDALVNKADAALYLSKREGRNRVTIAQDDPV